MRSKWCRTVAWLLSLLVISNSIFCCAVSAESPELPADMRWMKERVARMHARYTAPGDHDQFLHKLSEAKKRATTAVVVEALDQVIVWREELKPIKIRSGVSSIPDDVATNTLPKKSALNDIKNQQTTERESLLMSGTVKTAEQSVPAGVTTDRYQLEEGYIDLGVLQATWLERVNELRKKRWRATYSLHPQLHKTAADRSETMKRKGVADHKRFAKSPYYAYGEIEERFSDRGVTFVNISRATFTENIGWSTFRCTQQDCTQTAIDAMRETFNFYLREEGTKNDAHRRTLIHPLFTIVGLWIAVDEAAGKFYLTTHYGTQIE